jgi:hypothetical protein
LPAIEVTMSPGFVARPLGMFSQVGMMPTTLMGAPIVASALMVPKTERGAGHVELHLVHARRLLQRNAAGVEGDALADERDRRVALLAAAVLEDDQARRLLGAARDRQEGAHAELPDVGLLEHLRAHGLVLLRERLRGLAEVARGADVRRQVREVLHEGHARGDAAAVAHAALGVGGCDVRDHDADSRELRLRRLLGRLEIVDAVERVADALDGVARGVVRVEPRHRVGGEVGDGARCAALRQPLGCGIHRAPVGLAAERRFRPETDQQDPLGGTAADTRERVSLGALPGEVSAPNHAGDRAAARAVEPPRGLGHPRALVDADDGTGRALARAARPDRLETAWCSIPRNPR